MIANTAATETAPAPAEAPKAATKARVGARPANVAAAKGKAAKKASPAKKAPKSAKKAKAARDGSKTAKILDLLRRKEGTTLAQMMKVTGWLPHSVRGFISGTIGKKMGLTVVSAKGEDGTRNYSIKA